MRMLLMFVIRLYQWILGPWFGPVCRFEPSCSSYAFEAIGRHGAVQGVCLALKRLLRCHPWHPGGWDPVPEMESVEGPQRQQ